MTPTAKQAELSWSDRCPVARTYRKFLGKALLMMFAVIIVSAFLSPLLYMVTTSFQQPSQIATPGAPWWPAKPRRGHLRGRGVPDLHGHDRRRRPRPHARRAEPRVQRLRRPVRSRPRRRSSGRGAGGPSSSPGRSRPSSENYTTVWNQLNFPRLLTNTVPGSRCSARSGRCCRRSWSPTASPGSGSRGANLFFFILLGDDHPAQPGDAPAAPTSSSRGSAGTGPGCRSSSRTSSRTPSTCSCCASTS